LDRFFTTRRSVQNDTAERKTTYYRPSISTSKAHSKTHQKKKTPTSNSEAHLSPPLGDRPLVEEREEFFALSREEEKAV
jgi:hypothetical protein